MCGLQELVMRRLLVLCCMCLTVLAAAPAWADDTENEAENESPKQDRALAAIKRGEVRPLPEAIAEAKRQFDGDILRIDLEKDQGGWIYEFRVLLPSGERKELHLDAKTLAVKLHD
jgi:uncharacterized membrane protein YkoI